jgi:signal transduction histidine kinase
LFDSIEPASMTASATANHETLRYACSEPVEPNLFTELTGLLAAQRSVSAQIELSSLAETLLVIAVQYSGTDRGLLFFDRGGGPEVEAEITRRGGALKVICRRKLGRPLRFPRSVLNYVARMGESVVLEDASKENQFSADDYFGKGSVHSLLCFPLITQRQPVGVLYLENQRPGSAFSRNRLAMLELIGLQAAAALKNAILCCDLQHQEIERKRAKQELASIRQACALALGDAHYQLIAGLTAALPHELNQPLTAIQCNAEVARQLLDEQRPDLAQLSAVVDDIIEDNSRAADIVRNVRALVRRDAAEMSTVDLAKLLRDVHRAVGTQAGSKRITVHLDAPASLPTVIGNKTHLVQVMMNLISNAFEAMAEQDGSYPREIRIRADQRESGRIEIAVSDSGKGIDSEIMPRIFDVFFTTKPKGLGIGLAIVRSIVENHNGRLRATHNPDRGATIIFDLPIEPHRTQP